MPDINDLRIIDLGSDIFVINGTAGKGNRQSSLAISDAFS